MITKLPKKLAEQLPAIRDKWLAIGLSTEPIDRTKVEAALTKVYAVVDKPRPKYVILLRSPREVAYAVALLRSKSARVKNSVRAQVLAQVRAQVSAQVSDQVRDQVSDQVSDQVRAQVRAQVRDQVRDIINSWFWWGFGQFQAWWASYYEVAAGLGIDTAKLDGNIALTKCAGWSVLFWDWAFVSERPSIIKRDDRNRLHSENGPALAYPDGFTIHAIHGVRVPADVIEQPASITIQRIEKETNAEIRRVMIDLYGQARYLIDARADQIHADDYGTLYRKEVPGDEPIVMVKVVNSTAEPDGTFKDYFLRVPPDITTARGAVAWSFGKTAADYAPAVET